MNDKPIRIRRISPNSTVKSVGSNPLPSGTPSPELGAGPGPVLAATVPRNVLAKTKSERSMPTVIFNFFSSYSNGILSLI